MKTFEAKIYCGLRIGYSQKCYSLDYAKKVCANYVNTRKWCVTITETEYIYVDGSEKGFVVGIIRYPRFPLSDDELKSRTVELAKQLKSVLCQNRVTIVFPDNTIMIGDK